MGFRLFRVNNQQTCLCASQTRHVQDWFHDPKARKASPVTTLFSVVPFLGSLAGAGAFLVALTLAVPTTLLVVGLAWVAHRPLIGGLLLGGALLALVLLRQLHPNPAAQRLA